MSGDGLVGELLACFRILQCGVVTGHGGAESAPADSVARLIESAKRAFQADDAGEQIFFGNFAIAEGEAGSYGSAQRPLAVDVPRLESGRVFFDEEAANFFVFTLRPNDGDVGDGAAGDPHFFAVEDVLVPL